MCVFEIRVFDGDEQMVFSKSGFIIGDFCSSLDDCDRALNVIRGSIVKECVEREQRAYASPQFGARRKILNSFVLLRGKTDGSEELCVGKVLLLFSCSVKEESNGYGLAFVRYMDRMTPVNEGDGALKSVCLQCAPLSCWDEEADVGRGGERRELVAGDECSDVISFQSGVSTVHVV